MALVRCFIIRRTDRDKNLKKQCNGYSRDSKSEMVLVRPSDRLMIFFLLFGRGKIFGNRLSWDDVDFPGARVEITSEWLLFFIIINFISVVTL